MAGSSGFRGTSSLLMVVAIAAMAGFLWWVYQQAQSVESSVAPAMEDTASVEQTGVTPATLASNAGAAIGMSATFDSMEVTSSMGRALFTVALNDSMDLPVLMDPNLLQRGATVYGGDRVTVGGRFYTLNDSIQDTWLERGAVDSAQADEIPSMAAFMLADSLDIYE